MKILYLTLKSKWYDMIEARIKPEEYREIKPYWAKRFKYESDGGADIETGYNAMIFNHDFTHVQFARGGHFHPSLPQMLWELDEILVRTGNQEWGAVPGTKYFVIKLGNKLLIEI